MLLSILFSSEHSFIKNEQGQKRKAREQQPGPRKGQDARMALCGGLVFVLALGVAAYIRRAFFALVHF